MRRRSRRAFKGVPVCKAARNIFRVTQLASVMALIGCSPHRRIWPDHSGGPISFQKDGANKTIHEPHAYGVVRRSIRPFGAVTCYALGLGATMISAVWGVFVHRELVEASVKVKRLLPPVFILYIIPVLGLTAIAVAPLYVKV